MIPLPSPTPILRGPTEAARRANFLLCHARRVTQDHRTLESTLGAPSRRLLLAEPPAGAQGSVTRVPVADVTPDLFQAFVEAQIPIVIEGGCRGSRASGWTLDEMDALFGNIECSLRAPERATRRGRIREVLDLARDRDTSGLYVENVGNIARSVPDFDGHIGLASLQGLFPPDWGVLDVQAFLGGAATGTRYHCADNTNLFLNLQGRKRWTVVPPSHSAWMYEYPSTTGVYYHSPVEEADPRVFERYPLYAQTDRYEATLEAGDVLFCPRWWWHAIQNEGDLSFGCATRWAPPTFALVRGQNPSHLFSEMLLPSSALQKISKGAPITDELLRDKFYDGLLDRITLEPEARRLLPDFARDADAGEVDPKRIAEELAGLGGEDEARICDALDCLLRLEEKLEEPSLFGGMHLSRAAVHLSRWKPRADRPAPELLVERFLRR